MPREPCEELIDVAAAMKERRRRPKHRREKKFSTMAAAPKGTARRDMMVALQDKAQAKWEKVRSRLALFATVLRSVSLLSHTRVEEGTSWPMREKKAPL